MSSTPDTVDVDEVVAVLNQAQLNGYFVVVAMVVFVYDYLLTLSREVEYIWFRKLSLVTCLFYLSRYLPFFDTIALSLYAFETNPMNKANYAIRIIQFSSYMIGIALAVVILVARTVALWGKATRLAAFLLTFTAAIFIPAFYLTGAFLANTTYISFGGLLDGLRIATYDDKRLLIMFGLLFLIESTILLLTLKRFGRNSHSTLFKRILRDSIQFYVIICGLAVICFILVAISPTPITGVVLATLYRVVHSVFSCRIVLNIRQGVTPSRISGLSTGGTSTLDGVIVYNERRLGMNSSRYAHNTEEYQMVSSKDMKKRPVEETPGREKKKISLLGAALDEMDGEGKLYDDFDDEDTLGESDELIPTERLFADSAVSCESGRRL